MQRAKDTKVLHKVRWLKARTATFSIIGHQMLNWEWNFTKQSNWDTNIIDHHFVICTVKYTHLCIMHRVQTSVVLMGFSDPAPTSAPSKKSRSGISLMGWNCPPGVSLPGRWFFSFSPFFSAQFLFPSLIFIFYFFCGQFLFHFCFGPPLNQSFFWEALTYTQPTYRPSSYQPSSLPHVADPSVPRHLRSLPTATIALLTIARQVSSIIVITRGVVRSLGATQEELRSFNMMAKGKLLPSFFFINIFAFFLCAKKTTTTMSSSSSSISFSYK